MESHLDKDLLGLATLDPATKLSPFLAQPRLDWNINHVGGKWFAVGGRACNAADRFAGTPGNQNGCRASSNPASDSVVCLDSAVTMYPDLYQVFFLPCVFLIPTESTNMAFTWEKHQCSTCCAASKIQPRLLSPIPSSGPRYLIEFEIF